MPVLLPLPLPFCHNISQFVHGPVEAALVFRYSGAQSIWRSAPLVLSKSSGAQVLLWCSAAVLVLSCLVLGCSPLGLWRFGAERSLALGQILRLLLFGARPLWLFALSGTYSLAFHRSGARC